MKSFDIIIVGAGFTGLSAAREIRKHLNCSMAIASPSHLQLSSNRITAMLFGGQADNFTRISHAHGVELAVKYWNFGLEAFGYTLDFARERLIPVTEGEKVRVGSRVGDIGAAIQRHAERNGFSVVKEFVGHGIGRTFHEDPQIPHYGVAGKGTRLQPGMVFTIEPMINQGHWKTKVLRDGWTAITIDGGLSAQWEHTLALKSDGSIVILTESDSEKANRPVI